jgi:two-component system nitrate/nitrite response regulator NarL
MAVKIGSILVIGDSRLNAETLAATLASRHIVITSLTAALSCETPVDLVVCSATHYDSCIASLRVCGQILPETAAIVLGGPFDEIEHLQLIECGAIACIREHAPTEELLAAVESALRREVSCSSRMASVAFARLANLGKIKQLQETAALTYRECEVFHLVQQGLSNKEIAQLLAISVSTVKNHVHQVLAKLQIRSRWHAIDWEARLDRPGEVRGTQHELSGVANSVLG